MNPSFFIIDIRLLTRLFIGLILLGVGISKLVHLQQFQRVIREYHVLPSFLESKHIFTMILATCITLAELGSGFGLIAGMNLHFTVPFIQSLFAIFSGALIINLVRGRKDLSCHCGGVLGNHFISWWLVGRNTLMILILFILLATPTDSFTIGTFFHNHEAFTDDVWINTVLPIIILTVSILLIGAILNSAKSVFGKRDRS